MGKAKAAVAVHDDQVARREAFESYMVNTVMPAANTDDPEERRRILSTLIEGVRVGAEPKIEFGFNLPVATPELPRKAEAGDPRAWAAVGNCPLRPSEASPQESPRRGPRRPASEASPKDKVAPAKPALERRPTRRAGFHTERRAGSYGQSDG